METIATLSAGRVEWLAREFTAKCWPKSDGYFAKCFAAQERGELVVLVAADGDALLGYVKVVWMPEYTPFREAGIPEIQDLNVVPAARRTGVATRLLDRAEGLIGQRSSVAGIAVGLHPGYAAAQRLYARRGYVPDGKPLQYHGVPVREGQEVRLDNDLVMNLTKELHGQGRGMTIYKVSPPRESLIFEPSVFYRTADFKSSSTRPKPGYIRDTLLYAGDEREIAIHLFPDIHRLRVWLDDENRQRLADLGFATAPGNAVAIFVNEADQAQIADFKPTVYRFDAAAFERTPSNEFVSRKPVTAIGIEQFTMPVVVARWKIQVIAVPDVHECEKRLQQAGIECAMQTNRRSDVAFRPLTAAEEAAGYQVICDTVDWLRSKGIKLWEKPLPRETYAARQQRGENYGLFVGGELAGIVSLVRGAAQQWAEELPDRRIMWMSTLTTANAFRGRGLGRQIVEQAISHLAGRGEKMLYLDCKPGFLAEFYSGTGFEEVARKTATINRGAACYLAEVVLMRRVL